MFNMHSLWHKMLASKITDSFWKYTLLSWAKVINSIPKGQKDEVFNSPLLYNPLICNIPLFCHDWYNKSIIFIARLFCEGKLLSLDELTISSKIKTHFSGVPSCKSPLNNFFYYTST